MARRITIDQLAGMVARGFDDLRREMREGFASIQTVVDGHTATLDDHSHRLDRIERKLDNTIRRVDDNDMRLQVVEKRRSPRS